VLDGVAAASQNDVWAVGNNVKSSNLTEHWDGSQWSIVSSPNPGTDFNLLRAVTASASNFWAVGNYLNNHDFNNQTLTELYA
jgi:hypothetical protein